MSYYALGLEPRFFTAMNKVITPEEGFNLRLTPMYDGPKVAYMTIEVESDVTDPVRHEIILRGEDIVALRDYLLSLSICNDGK